MTTKNKYANITKRVVRACDLCRRKKCKCEGINPCFRCLEENRVCVFSKSMKEKDKPYLNGYSELLEKRLDLLTKSFEKIIILAGPHLSFLKQFEDENGRIQINSVILYLIKEQELLNTLLIEIKNVVPIVARLNIDDHVNLMESSRLLAEYKMKGNISYYDDSYLENISKPNRHSGIAPTMLNMFDLHNCLPLTTHFNNIDQRDNNSSVCIDTISSTKKDTDYQKSLQFYSQDIDYTRSSEWLNWDRELPQPLLLNSRTTLEPCNPPALINNDNELTPPQ